MNLPPLRRTPGELFEQMRQEMDQLYRRFVGETGSGSGKPGGLGWSPRVDVEETDQELLIKADLPGVDPQSVDITVADGALVVQGEKKEERDRPGTHYHCTERLTGRFHRSIPLPAGTDPDRIQARSVHGVLLITVPKKPEVQPKKIFIKSPD